MHRQQCSQMWQSLTQSLIWQPLTWQLQINGVAHQAVPFAARPVNAKQSAGEFAAGNPCLPQLSFTESHPAASFLQSNH